MTRLTACLLVVILFQAGCSSALDYPEAQITIKVVDEDGKPIEGAKAGITFEVPKGTSQGINDVTIEEITNTTGVLTAKHRTFDKIGYGATKYGYYESLGEFKFEKIKNGRWQPWNPEFMLVLRKKENPVPMYARNTQMTPIILPAANKSIGFDLMEYDWVTPYGKGKQADIIFKMTGSFINKDEFSNKLEVNFSNKFDGIQLVKEDRRYGSMLKLPRLAPETGYNGNLIRSISRMPGKPLKEDTEENNNYIFRVRSEEKDGKLIRAMYGKIQGDIEFGVKNANQAVIVFKYYLNPDYTRNLEFDPKQNLFNNLKSFERIGLD